MKENVRILLFLGISAALIIAGLSTDQKIYKSKPKSEPAQPTKPTTEIKN